MKNRKDLDFAVQLHEQVPPDWYYQSIKIDPFQRFWHKRRFEEVSKLIEPVKGEVLDIGCADGMFSKVILDKSHAKKIIGIDVLKSSVSWANKHWGEKMKFLVGDAQNLRFENNSFEAVFCLEVLEHVQNPSKVLEEIKRVLKKNGYAVFLVPTDNFLFRMLWFFWLHFYPRGWVWKETHIQTYKKNYLTRLCQRAGFKIEKNNKFILGMLQAIKVRK